ncbi:MAG: D-alanine--D-alanine ligase, partial [Bacteroidota bacterium]
MRIGIFFGGNSREREVSFAGGRTVYDNLDKNLFDAVPLFVDSFNNIILLDWKYIYKGSIRDFYPPVNYITPSAGSVQIYAESIESAYADNGIHMARELGKVIKHHELKNHIDFAFLALHGQFGEDGSIQGLLEWHQIPYSGSGILPSAAGMNKRLQKEYMKQAGMSSPDTLSISREQWFSENRKHIHARLLRQLKSTCVVKPANQGSSVGVSVIAPADFKA